MSGRTLNSRFVRLMRTGPVDGLPVVGGGGGQGQQGQQQGGGQQGAGGGGPPASQQGGQQQGQGQQGDPYGNLLDQARQQGGQTGDQQGQQQSGQQSGQQQGPLTAEDVARIVESAVDRRINAISNPGGGRNRGNQNQQRDQQGQQGGDGQQVASVDHGARWARWEARSAFREYVGDEVSFLGATERAAANAIGTALIATWDGQGDADQFGRDVSKQVATTMKELGDMYRRIVLEQLRRQGLLKEQASGPGAGSGPAGFPLPGGGNGFTLQTTSGGIQQKNPAAALQTAIAMADQYNQQAGHTPAGHPSQ